MPHRYFSSQIDGTNAWLSGPDARHLCVVLRAKPGDEVLVCDGQ